MFLGELLAFWLLVGLAFFGLRRLSGGEESRGPRVIPRSNGGPS